MKRTYKGFYKLLFSLSLPIVLQQMLSQGMYLLDSLMIGSLGQNEIIAVANAGQIAFLFNIFLFGACSASTIFSAQFWGKQEIDGITKTFSLNLVIVAIITIPFFLIAFFFPEACLSIINPEPIIVATGAPYLRVLSVSFLFTAMYLCFTNILKGIRKVTIPLFASLLTVGLNAFINYSLIFGNFGFPKLGVVGAAIGTAIAFFAEALLLGIYFFSKHNPARIKLKNLRLRDKVFRKSYLKTSFPIVLSEIIWAIGNFIIIIIYNRLGFDMAGAIAILAVIERMCYVFYQGVANSAGIMVGNTIGEGKPETAYAYGGRCLIIGPAMAVLLGFVVIALSGVILPLYKLSGESVNMLMTMFYFLPLTMSLGVFNCVNLVGVLRGGGDSMFAWVSDMGCMYLIGIPAALITGFVLNLYPPFVYFIYVLAQETVKGLLGLVRYRRKKWIHDLTANYQPGEMMKTDI